VLATCEAAARFRFYALLRGLAYSAARTGDDDDLAFDSLHEVVLSTFYFPLSRLFSCRLFSREDQRNIKCVNLTAIFTCERVVRNQILRKCNSSQKRGQRATLAVGICATKFATRIPD
jgi:hypothetical protein